MSVSKFQSRNKLLSNLKKILKCLHKLYKKTEKKRKKIIHLAFDSLAHQQLQLKILANTLANVNPTLRCCEDTAI